MFIAALFFFLGFLRLAFAQWAFTVPDGDLGEVAPGNNVRQGDIHDFAWLVGLENEPVKVLDAKGHASLWITSGLDESFNKLLAADVDSSAGGTWAWTVDLSDNVIDSCGGVFLYRLERPVSSTAATYDWNTPLSVSSVSFRILKKSDTSTTQAMPTEHTTDSMRQTTLAIKTTVATSSTLTTTEDTGSMSADSGGPFTTGTGGSEGLKQTSSSSTSTGISPTEGSSTATTSGAQPGSDSGLSTGAKAGIGIGAVAAAALVIIAAILYLRRPGKNAPATAQSAQGYGEQMGKPDLTSQSTAQGTGYGGTGWGHYPVPVMQQYMTGSNTQTRAELGGEAHGNGRHELPGK
ncbi:hypothetical protein N0V90_011204 [Kalmusia sp. IMI 367209]|nr:hypothetical protein N0V90_011204 [Kalmusia sp. IMI 367209]